MFEYWDGLIGFSFVIEFGLRFVLACTLIGLTSCPSFSVLLGPGNATHDDRKFRVSTFSWNAS